MKLYRKYFKANLRKSSLWIYLTSIMFIASGCYEDLSQVQQFSQVSGTIEKTSKELGQDIYQSCLRRETRKDETQIIQEAFVRSQMNSLPSVQPSSTETTSTTPYTFSPIRIDERCDRFKPVATSTIQANFLVVNYLNSLGQLASDQQVSLNQNLTKLGDAITNLNPTFEQAGISININPDYVKAGENIAGFLLDKFVVKPIQRKNLKSVIVCQDENFQDYTLLLNEINELYRDIWLESEKTGLYRYFEERARLAPRIYANNLQGFANEIQIMTQQYTEDKAQLNGRKEQVEAYIALLSLTAQNHRQLAKIFGDDMNEKAIQSFCPQNQNSDTAEISQTLEPPTQKQLKEAKKVLDNYLEEAKPLVAKLNR